ILRYAAVPGGRLPQPKRVRSVLARWAEEKGYKPVRVAALARPDEGEIVRLLRAWDVRRGSAGAPVTLAYPVALPAEAVAEEGGAGVRLHERLAWLFARALPWVNGRLRELHREEVLAAAPGWPRPVWKHGGVGAPPGWAPSRLGRCLLETVGRVVAAQAERRRAFEALRLAWDAGVEAALAKGRCYAGVLRAVAAWSGEGEVPAAGLLLGVAEQLVADHGRRTAPERVEWDRFFGVEPPAPWAGTYTELQGPPVLRRQFLTLAADDGARDGEVIRYRLSADGRALEVSLHLPSDPGLGGWSWCSFRVPVPERVRAELARGGRLCAPDLRRTAAGKWVLDLKVEAQPVGGKGKVPGRVLAFDWGLRKLVTAVVVEKGRQLSRPFFLRAGGVYARPKELRAHASLLQKKADRLRRERLFTPGLSAGAQERLEEAERKARAELESVWRRYRQLQDQLAHLAANFLLELALRSGCGVIVGEWLGSLKSRDKSSDLNWRINSQIRAAIIEKLRYKARRAGVRVQLVWPRGTSHRCPRCGAEDQSIVDHPPNFEPRRKPGPCGWTLEKPGTKRPPRRCSWFQCRCGFNGDRDYVAALNVGIEYFAEEEARSRQKGAGRKLAEAARSYRQAVSYTGAAVARPFTPQNEWFPVMSGRRGERRPRASVRQWGYRGGSLCGWRGRCVRLTPYVVPQRLPRAA
ncbi:MAG: transposase, partial [Bacillota bacterium]